MKTPDQAFKEWCDDSIRFRIASDNISKRGNATWSRDGIRMLSDLFLLDESKIHDATAYQPMIRAYNAFRYATIAWKDISDEIATKFFSPDAIILFESDTELIAKLREAECALFQIREGELDKFHECLGPNKLRRVKFLDRRIHAVRKETRYPDREGKDWKDETVQEAYCGKTCRANWDNVVDDDAVSDCPVCVLALRPNTPDHRMTYSGPPDLSNVLSIELEWRSPLTA